MRSGKITLACDGTLKVEYYFAAGTGCPGWGLEVEGAPGGTYTLGPGRAIAFALNGASITLTNAEVEPGKWIHATMTGVMNSQTPLAVVYEKR